MWSVCLGLSVVCGVAAAVAAAAGGTVIIERPDAQPPLAKLKVLNSDMKPKNIPRDDTTTLKWKQNGIKTIRDKIQEKMNKNKAQNGIMFIGDGMSMSTVMAARIYAGQKEKGRAGEDNTLSFEKFPVTGLSRTYCVDAQVPDSACTATAYLTGVKTRYGTIGLNGNVRRGVCATQIHQANWVSSIASWAIEKGMDAGIVTTTRVTHASPAGNFAHVAERDWEADSDLPEEVAAIGCKDIAYQLVAHQPGSLFKVVLGGGRREFLPNVTENDLLGKKAPIGKRLDGLDLTEQWKLDKVENNVTHKYIQNREEFLDVFNLEQDELPEYLLGLFQDSHMNYHLKDTSTQPTLAEMTEVAIRMLSRNPKGYFLFVEGGRIDHAHHDVLAHLALDETLEYAKAVQKAQDITDERDTLIVVTSDHSHTMTVSGYPSRGNDILGVVDTGMGMDGKPYTTISYANGISGGARKDVTLDPKFIIRDVNYQYPSSVPLDSETHGGEDVAVFAQGPWQHLFTGSYEQSAIPHMMAYAMCLGPDLHQACIRPHNSGVYLRPSILSIVTIAVILAVLNR